MNKYHARKTEYNGREYHSQKEANRAWELDMLVRAGEASKVEPQVPLDLLVNGTKVGKYIADFRVTYRDGHVEYEDVKGMRTDIYILKKKMVEAQYGIKIIET